MRAAARNERFEERHLSEASSCQSGVSLGRRMASSGSRVSCSGRTQPPAIQDRRSGTARLSEAAGQVRRSLPCGRTRPWLPLGRLPGWPPEHAHALPVRGSRAHDPAAPDYSRDLALMAEDSADGAKSQAATPCGWPS